MRAQKIAQLGVGGQVDEWGCADRRVQCALEFLILLDIRKYELPEEVIGALRKNVSWVNLIFVAESGRVEMPRLLLGVGHFGSEGRIL